PRHRAPPHAPRARLARRPGRGRGRPRSPRWAFPPSPRALQRQLDLGATARGRANRGVAAVPGHAPDDRVANPAPVVRQRLRVEPRPTVAYEDLELLGAGFG